MTAQLEDDLGLFTVEEVRAIQPTPPRLEDNPVEWTLFGDAHGTGPEARAAAFAEWVARHGLFDCLARSHAWRPGAAGAPGSLSDAAPGDHVAGVWDAELRCRHSSPSWRGRGLGGPAGDSCRCVGSLMHRGICSCGWESVPLLSENAASEAILDHLWGTGWRELPLAPAWSYDGPDSGKGRAVEKWLEGCAAVGYDVDELRAGGPIRTARTGCGTRHVPGRTPFRGYDVGVLVDQS